MHVTDSAIFTHTVTLTSSADILCPGDTVVFTCVTDTGRLVWEIININNRHSFHSPAQITTPITADIFTLTLLSVTNSDTYQSTAVGHNVSIDYNNTEISCIDDLTAFNSKLSIIIGKKIRYLETSSYYHALSCSYIISTISTS